MYLDRGSETKWIVKSENKILGPYSFDQIVDLIRKKQISLIDEIRDSETRWLYVRENTEFKNIVEEMRKEIDASAERTKTYQSTSRSADDIIQKTKTDHNLFTDINMETKEAVIMNESFAQAEIAPKKSIPGLIKVKSYGARTDRAVEKNVVGYFKKFVIAFVLVSISVAVSFFAYDYMQKQLAIKQEEELVRQIKKYNFLGANQKAVDLFSRLPVAGQKKLIPELLGIYSMLEAQGFVDKEDLAKLKSNPILSSEQKANIELIYFGVALQKNNFGDAQDYLVKATTFLQSSPVIKENEALLMLKKGQFAEAYDIYNNIFKKEKSGRYLFGMVMSYFNSPSADRLQYGRKLMTDLEKYTSVYYDYKKELLLAQIALSVEYNELVLQKVAKAQFFNLPCRMAETFTKPGLLAPNSYTWKENKVIGEIAQKSLTPDELILFQLHDYLELDQLSIAAEFVSNNLSKVNSASVRSQMDLLLFNAQKRNNEVVILEKSNKLDMNSELNHFLVARNKIEMGDGGNIASHLKFLSDRQQYFYRDWLQLEQLIKMNVPADIKIFLNDRFITIQNFSPVLTAKSLVF